MSKLKVQSTVYPDNPAPTCNYWWQWLAANSKREWYNRFHKLGIMEVISVNYYSEELGTEYGMDIEIEANVCAVDHGIGEYDFWGTKGYHTDVRPEVNDIYVTSLAVYNEDSKPVEITREIEKLVNRWMLDNSSKIEEDILEKAVGDC